MEEGRGDAVVVEIGNGEPTSLVLLVRRRVAHGSRSRVAEREPSSERYEPS